MPGKRRQGISLKLSTLFDIAPDQEIQSFISAKTIRQTISKSLTELGYSRFQTQWIEQEYRPNPNIINITTPSDGVPDFPPPGSSAVKSPSSSYKRLTKGTTHGTKHQVLGQKRHFSLTRDKTHPSFCLDYLKLHIRRSVPQLSQEVEHQIIHSGGLSNMHQIGILSSYQTMYQRSAPQLIKGITHHAVLGCMKKFNRVCASRNHIRLLGVLSLVVSSGCLGGLHALGCQSRASRTD